MNRQHFQYHPVFSYTFIPDLRARVNHEDGGYLIRVNSSGFRSDVEFGPKKAGDEFRIMLFGDSYTVGDGVANKDRYSDVLQRLLPKAQV